MFPFSEMYRKYMMSHKGIKIINLYISFLCEINFTFFVPPFQKNGDPKLEEIDPLQVPTEHHIKRLFTFIEMWKIHRTYAKVKKLMSLYVFFPL